MKLPALLELVYDDSTIWLSKVLPAVLPGRLVNALRASRSALEEDDFDDYRRK